MILKPVRQTSTATALKAERDRDMAQAMQDYENEQCARLANMARLRALRLEKERAESKAATPRPLKKKKLQPKPGASHLNIGLNSREAPLDARRLPPALAMYRTPSHARSVAELTITAVPLVTLWAAAWFAFWLGYAWVTPFIAVPAAGFLLRLFMIQHDCGHGTFFSRRLANDWVGRIISVLTLTPYDFWRRTHAIHHASAGNLDRRGIGDVDTLTVHEYDTLSHWGRLRYRLYRHPLVMFGIGPAYLFLLQHRLPVGLMRNGWQPWASTMATNLAIALVVAAMVWLIGIEAFLLVHLPIILLAAAAGVWLFYVQHQFEHTAWQRNDAWNLHEASLHGSSHYDLPALLRWFTANIGIHHVHHLCSRIPYYRLPVVLHDHPELRDLGRLTLRQSLRCVHLALWDEEQNRLVTFREATQQLASTSQRVNR